MKESWMLNAKERGIDMYVQQDQMHRFNIWHVYIQATLVFFLKCV